MQTYTLRLYISGMTRSAQRAIATLETICAESVDARYDIEVIDVMVNPDAGAQADITATPTLIKSLPPPLRRIIGELRDRAQVLRGLDLEPAGSPLQTTVPPADADD